MKYWVGELEVGSDIKSLCLDESYSSALVLVRHHHKPLGWIELRSSEEKRAFSSNDVADAISVQLGLQLTRELFLYECLPGHFSDENEPAAISVIVCTRDRAELLEKCLASLAQLEYAKFEVIVVDNASSDSGTREVAERFQTRYVREERPGLDWARNRGVIEAQHEIVAFIDDDARADKHWLRAINRSFAEAEVMATTGLVVPQELETEAQCYFEWVYGGMGKGMSPKRFCRSTLSERMLLWASRCGVGANMAFRKRTFEQVGLFDTALDVGTAARGAGDIEFFHRVIARGLLLRYEPEAIVWHLHRRDFDSLRRQIQSNGYSVVPYLLTCLRNGTTSYSQGSLWLKDLLISWIGRRLLKPGRHRRSLVLAELSGLFSGLFVYPAARRTAAKLANSPRPHSSKFPENSSFTKACERCADR